MGKTIDVGAEPIAVAFDPSGDTAYVLNRESRTVSVLDSGAGTVRSTFSALGQTGAFLLSPQGDEIYVSHPDRDAISVIGVDGKLRRVLDVSAQGPQMPGAMAMPRSPSPG